MKIKSKVTLFFSTLILIMGFISIYHILVVNNMSKTYANSIAQHYDEVNIVSDINRDFIHIVNIYSDFFKNPEDTVSLNAAKSSIDSKIMGIEKSLTGFKLDAKLASEIKILKSSIGETYDKLLINDLEKAIYVSNTSVKSSIEKISDQIKVDEMVSSKALSHILNSNLGKNIMIEILIIVVIAIIALSFILNVNKSISNSIEFIRDILKNATDGKLNNKQDIEEKNEIYSLTNDINAFTKVINKFIEDIKEMSTKQNKIKSYSYTGIFYDTVIDMDKNIRGFREKIESNTNFMRGLVDGNFDVSVQDKVGIELKNKIQNIVSKVIKMSEDKCKGECTFIQDTEFKGEWGKLFYLINKSFDNLYGNIKIIKEDLTEIKRGSFSTSYSSLRGEMLGLFQAYEEYKNVTNKYIEETCGLISSVYNNSSCYEISNEYKGNFEDLRNAVNKLVEKTKSTDSRVTRVSHSISKGVTLDASEKSTLAKRKQRVKVPATSGSVAVLGFSGASVYNRTDFGKY